jgi:hypothetical protein
LDYAQFRAYLSDHMKNEAPSIRIDDSIYLGTMVFTAAFCVSDTWLRSGNIEEGDFDLITSEVIGALQGLSASERGAGRMSSVFDELEARPN